MPRRAIGRGKAKRARGSERRLPVAGGAPVKRAGGARLPPSRTQLDTQIRFVRLDARLGGSLAPSTKEPRSRAKKLPGLNSPRLEAAARLSMV